MHNVDFHDLAVVVQGAVRQEFIQICLGSIRKYLPGAQIIVSTWEGSDTADIDCDKLVCSKDPGCFPYDVLQDSLPNNIDRQIVSTQAGLQCVDRKYCIKMRTDFYLTSNHFLDFYEKYGSFYEKYHFLSKRVIVCSLYSRNPRYRHACFAMPYCISDFFYFGLTKDVLEIFHHLELTADRDKQYFHIYSGKRKELHYSYALCRFMPEQAIWMGFLKQHMPRLYCEHRDDVNAKNIFYTEQSIANNTVILSPVQIGLASCKKDMFAKGSRENCYSHVQWKFLYHIFSRKKKYLKGVYLVTLYVSYFCRKCLFFVSYVFYAKCKTGSSILQSRNPERRNSERRKRKSLKRYLYDSAKQKSKEEKYEDTGS